MQLFDNLGLRDTLEIVWIWMQVAEAEEKTAGGLLLTEAAKEKPSIGTVRWGILEPFFLMHHLKVDLCLIMFSWLGKTDSSSWAWDNWWGRQQETPVCLPREHSFVLKVCREWLQGQWWDQLHCTKGFWCDGSAFIVISHFRRFDVSLNFVVELPQGIVDYKLVLEHKLITAPLLWVEL